MATTTFTLVPLTDLIRTDYLREDDLLYVVHKQAGIYQDEGNAIYAHTILDYVTSNYGDIVTYNTGTTSGTIPVINENDQLDISFIPIADGTSLGVVCQSDTLEPNITVSNGVVDLTSNLQNISSISTNGILQFRANDVQINGQSLMTKVSMGKCIVVTDNVINLSTNDGIDPVYFLTLNSDTITFTTDNYDLTEHKVLTFKVHVKASDYNVLHWILTPQWDQVIEPGKNYYITFDAIPSELIGITDTQLTFIPTSVIEIA